MKQVKLYFFFAIALCVLIGYFEPANAQSTTGNVYLFSTTSNCHFWPNPVGQGATVNAYSADVPTGGYLTSTMMGGQYAISVINAGQPLPASEVENNWWFQPVVDTPGSLTLAVDSASSATDSSGLSTVSAATLSLATDTISADTTTSDSLTVVSASGSASPLTSTAPGGSTPSASEVENNWWFQPIITVSTLSLPVVPDGTYILVVTGQSGNVYTSKINITSK